MITKSLIILIIVNFIVSAQQVKVLPLGDSITRDSFSADPRPDSLLTGYRQPLWLLLETAGYMIDFIGSDSAGYGAVPKFDPDNAGFGGYSTKQLYNLILTGYDRNGNKITDGPYLNFYTPDIILLHIGTNGLDTTTSDLENLLNYIDDFEDSTNTEIWVILAKIINRVPYSSITTAYNNNIDRMAKERIQNGDNIKLVDMENDAGFIYQIDTTVPYSDGDMFDSLHPNKSGNNKMANLFYDTLKVLLDNISLVKLKRFYALSNQDSVILEWETTLELDNYGFEIERSPGNSGIWENIGFVEGADNSYQIQWYAFVDNNIDPSNDKYKYRLKQLDFDGNFRYLGELDVGVIFTDVDDSFNNFAVKDKLIQNYPNPFNSTTIISWQMQDRSHVLIKVYDMLGREITTLVNNELSAGIHQVEFNADYLPSGIYLYKIKTVKLTTIKKMLLIK
jgi:lysophospholipase L1-like esterase